MSGGGAGGDFDLIGQVNEGESGKAYLADKKLCHQFFSEKYSS